MLIIECLKLFHCQRNRKFTHYFAYFSVPIGYTTPNHTHDKSKYAVFLIKKRIESFGFLYSFILKSFGVVYVTTYILNVNIFLLSQLGYTAKKPNFAI